MDLVELGAAVRLARRELGMSQERAAALAGLSRQTVSGLESGTIPDLGVRKLMRLLEAVGLDLALVPRVWSPPTLDDLTGEGPL